MKKHLVILLGGYYPTYSAPGLVIEKMLPELKKHFRLTLVTVRRVVHELGREFDYQGVRVIEHSYALNDRVVESRCLGGTSFRFWRVLEKFLKMLQSGVETHAWNTAKALDSLEMLYREDPFSSLLAVAFPIEALQTGMLFKRVHQEVRFVTYSTDTWYRHPVLASLRNRIFFSNRIVRKERDAYRGADYCFFSQEIYRDSKEFLYPISGKAFPLKYIVAPPSDKIEFGAGDGKKHIVYAGTFSKIFRNPQYFLEVLDFLFKNYRLEMCIDFYLTTQACADMVKALKERYPGKVFLYPPVSGDEIKRIIRKADILLNFSNDLDSFSPSKIFDYLATGRPIIDVVYKGRVQNDIFKKYPVLLEIENAGNIEADAVKLFKFVGSSSEIQLQSGQIADVYSEYLPSAALAELIGRLNESPATRSSCLS